MTCKFCNNKQANWPENYTPGCNMIEMDTGIIHTYDRCKELQGEKNTTGWIKKLCPHGEHWFSRKHYNSITAVCEDMR